MSAQLRAAAFVHDNACDCCNGSDDRTQQGIEAIAAQLEREGETSVLVQEIYEASSAILAAMGSMKRAPSYAEVTFMQRVRSIVKHAEAA